MIEIERSPRGQETLKERKRSQREAREKNKRLSERKKAAREDKRH